MKGSAQQHPVAAHPPSAVGDLEAVAEARSRPGGVSLRARALQFLARRDHSRAELRSKLLQHAADEAALDALLDDLESVQLLSDRRYAEVVARSRGARYGVASVARTLSRNGVAPEVAAEALAPLRVSERQRALEVCRRRFKAPAADLRERARQHRFLLARGFNPATVSWVLKHCDRDFSGADD